MYPDDSFFEEVINFYFSPGGNLPVLNLLLNINFVTLQYPVISFRKTPVFHTTRTETTSDKAGQVRLEELVIARLTVLMQKEIISEA